MQHNYKRGIKRHGKEVECSQAKKEKKEDKNEVKRVTEPANIKYDPSIREWLNKVDKKECIFIVEYATQFSI